MYSLSALKDVKRVAFSERVAQGFFPGAVCLAMRSSLMNLESDGSHCCNDTESQQMTQEVACACWTTVSSKVI